MSSSSSSEASSSSFYSSEGSSSEAASETTASEEALYHLVNVYTSVMFCLGLLFVSLLPLLLLIFRRHPLIKSRYVYVCIAEIFVVGIILLLGSSSSSATFYADWGLSPCWLYNFVYVGFSAVIWNITASRLALFYRTAQVNTWNVEDQDTLLDKFVHVFGLLNAPSAAFRRCENRLEFLRMEKRSSLTIGRASSSPSSTSSSISASSSSSSSSSDDTASEAPRHPLMEPSTTTIIVEILLWMLKLLAWWAFWGVLAIVLTYTIAPDQFFMSLLVAENTCYNPSTILIQCQLVIWNLCQFTMVVTCIRKPADSLGLKYELLFTQSLFLVMWGANATQVLVHMGSYLTKGVFLDLMASSLHALVTGAYPLILILYRHIHQRRLGKEDLNIRTMWTSETGRALIMDVTSRGMAIENSLFLSQTEGAMDHVHRAKVKHVYDKYVRPGAPFEINIPDELREKWRIIMSDTPLVMDDVVLAQIVTETRDTIFFIIHDNYGYQIRRELHNQQRVMTIDLDAVHIA
eukprot:TRINITY_DN19740_c0_g1_i1.p1 TRINITY_DN19740_c0_g1~~TRINITY_DN19740_c0_g1_i1.p1  ORF type:complete len:519 (-),score=80.03 TRINITY_DN19740_c0_g1_i1:8-1564(-)